MSDEACYLSFHEMKVVTGNTAWLISTRIQFIRCAQALGFSLKETSELLSLRMEPGTTCGYVKSQVKAKIVDIEKKYHLSNKLDPHF